MTERWISTKKHYCNVCQCWISGHPMNVANHMMSESHKSKNKKVLHAMQEKERKRKIDQSYLAAEIQRMEMAGCQSFLEKDTFGTNQKRNLEVLKNLNVDVKQEEALDTCRYQSNAGCISAEPKIKVSVKPPAKTVNDNPEVYVPQENIVESGWIASFDPVTNTSFYFNPITGKSSRVNPLALNQNAVRSPAPLFTACNEAHAQKVISDLLPTVNEMTDSYKEFLLCSQKANQKQTEPCVPNEKLTQEVDKVTQRLGVLPKCLADKLRSRLDALESKKTSLERSKESRSEIFCKSVTEDLSRDPTTREFSDPNLFGQTLKCDKNDYDSKTSLPAQFISSLTYQGFKPGYIFTTISGATGYYWDSPSLSYYISSLPLVPLTETCLMKLSQQSTISLNLNQRISKPSAPVLSGWTEVPPEESKFGDSVKKKIPTVPLPNTKLEYEAAKCASERSDTKTIAALKEDAERSGQLNFDDLKRNERVTFGLPRVDCSDSLADGKQFNTVQFKKRCPKNSTLNKKKRLTAISES